VRKAAAYINDCQAGVGGVKEEGWACCDARLYIEKHVFLSFLTRYPLIPAFVTLTFESVNEGDFFLLFLFIWCYPPAYCPNLTYMRRAILAV